MNAYTQLVLEEKLIRLRRFLTEYTEDLEEARHEVIEKEGAIESVLSKIKYLEVTLNANI